MTKQNEQEALGTAMNKTEMFFEKNSKSMIIALLALFVLAAAIFGYRQLISQPRERKAAEMIAQAQYCEDSISAVWRAVAAGDPPKGQAATPRKLSGTGDRGRGT